MPSARRTRTISFAAVLVVLVIFYVTTGPSRTRESEFYTRTLALMKDQERVVIDPAIDPKADTGSQNAPNEAYKFDTAIQANAGHKPAQAPEDAVFRADAKLRDRLKTAEQMAKKSADEKYKALEDVEKAIQEDKAARVAAYGSDAPEAQDDAVATILGEKGIAGRKFMAQAPAPSSGDSRHPPEESKPADLSRDISAVFQDILKKSPVIIFSKSYCPYSMKAKKILLETYTIKPTPYVVELDQHELGADLQDLLGEKTGRRTVPNILINGKSVGGGDDIEDLMNSGDLKKVFLKAGNGKIKSVEENKKDTGDHHALVR